MRRKKLLWQIYLSYLLIIVALLSLIGWFAHRQALVELALIGAGIAVLAAVVGYYVARTISRPLEDIKEIADRMAKGDLQARVADPSYEEMTGLASSLNQMAKQLEERIGTLTQQRLEQEAMVSSMVEGVLAVDTNEKVISLNESATQLLGANGSDFVGKPIQEIVRNSDLQRLITQTLHSNEAVESDITLSNGTEKFLQATGSILKGSNGESIGALIVLNDVSRIRKLENLRRDFVANVSHELKTPITSIKGFVETLLEGAVKQPEDAERFLKIISRQANRLQAIIEDLLKLSRIEQESERGEIQLERGRIRDVLVSAVNACEEQVKEKEISVKINCDENLYGRINAQLLEQAIVNLVDNAAKYSQSGAKVNVEALQNGKVISIAVTDSGPGISVEHFSRLFERFYRVDKARSRSQGGTGLGLAIVKHIILAHGGSVKVASELGKGSTFTLTLPKS